MNKAYEFPAELKSKVDDIEKKFDDTQRQTILYANKLNEPIFQERDELLKGVEGFWIKALSNCEKIMIYIDDEDRPILEYLTNIRVDRSQTDPREAAIHFDFKENDYFSDSTLSKTFKVKKDADPLSAEFDFPHNCESAKTTINWKSEEKNQTKLRPTVMDNENEDFEPGSFFGVFFEQSNSDIASAVGDILINDFYPRAIEYYTNEVDEFGELDEFEDMVDDEDDEESDDDDREIDLEEEERRLSKKHKKE